MEFHDDMKEMVSVGRFKPAKHLASSWQDLFHYLQVSMQFSIPIPEALAAWMKENGTPSEPFHRLLSHCSQGRTILSFIVENPRYFPEEVWRLFKAAGPNADLQSILAEAEEMLKQQLEFSRMVESALIYPFATASVAVLVAAVLLWKVIPTFSSLFLSAGARLPGSTRLMIAVSNGIVDYGLLLMILIFFPGLLFLKLMKSDAFTARVAVHLPVLGNKLLQRERAKLLRILSIISKEGPLDTEALEKAADYLALPHCKREWRSFLDALRRGEPWDAALSNLTFLSPDILYVLRTFSRNGHPSDLLEITCDLYQEKARRAQRYTARMVEPLLVLALGLIVGGLVLAMYAPIFDLSRLVP